MFMFLQKLTEMALTNYFDFRSFAVKLALQELDKLVTHGGRAIMDLADYPFILILESDYSSLQGLLGQEVELRFKIELPYDRIRQVALTVRDILDWISRGYAEIKDDVTAMDGIQLKSFFRTAFTEVIQNMKSVDEVRSIMEFYAEYQSWFEEIHFSEKLDEVAKEMNR